MILAGITGPAGAGKDTVADYLARHHNFTKLSFAGPLKAGLAAMGLPEPANRDNKEKIIEGLGFSWRQAAQQLGTEWGRALNPDIWTLLVERRIGQIKRTHLEPRIVLSDVRFDNEAEMIRKLGGTVIHLHGRKAELGQAAGHASEAGVYFHEHLDYVFHNTGTIEDLLRAVSLELDLRYVPEPQDD